MRPGEISSRRRPGARLVAVAAAALVALLAQAAPAAADELSVLVSPGTAHIAPGEAVGFTAEVLDAGGDVVDAEVLWSVIPPRAGSMSGGTFVAGESEGRAIVRAVAVLGPSSGTGHAVVEVSSQPNARLSVTVRPSGVTVPAGETRRFTASVTDPATGDDVDAQLRWVVLPEGMGEIDQEGLFTAGHSEMSGRVAVRATARAREGVGDAAVVVGSPPGPDVRVSIAPPYALMGPGDEAKFDAIVVSADGSPVDADVAWSVMPARLGVVDGDGGFTAGPDEAVGKLVATVATVDGPARGFANIEIRETGPTGVRVRLRPREAAVFMGGDVQFEAVVEGPDGESVAVPVEWTVRPDWIGSIDGTGLFTASDEMTEPSANGAWMGAVVASIETSGGPASDAARVIVREGGPAMRLRIYPHSPVVAPGQDIQFETKVIGAEGPIDWTTEWAVFPEDLGTITPEGLFTANPTYDNPSSDEFGPHQGVVAARAMFGDGSSLNDRANVHVRIPGQPVRVMVKPAIATVPPAGSVEFDAIVLGPDGQQVDLPVTWNVSPEHVGHISPDGTFTAANLNVDANSWQRPRATVVAEAHGGSGSVFRGTAVVIVDLPNPEITIRVSPNSVTVAQGEDVQFTAEAFTAEGVPLDLPLEWKVSDPVVGTVDQAGLFTAAQSLPQGHSRHTTVLAGAEYNGRVYWDYAAI